MQGQSSSLQTPFRSSSFLSDKHRQNYQPAAYVRISLRLMGMIGAGIQSVIRDSLKIFDAVFDKGKRKGKNND